MTPPKCVKFAKLNGLASIFLFISLAAFSSPVSAQDNKTDDIFPDEILPGNVFTIDPKKVDTFIDLGVGVLSRPDYLGSDKTLTNVLPYLSAEYKGRWFVNPILGAGFHAVNNDHLRLSGGISFASGRDADQTPFDNEAFDLDHGAAGFAALRYGFKYAALDVVANKPLTGDIDGTEVDVRLLTLFPVSDDLRISPGIGANFASKGFVNSFYGLTPEQAAIAQTDAVSYDGGLTSWNGSLAAFWVPRKDVTVVSLISYDMLDGSVKDSPLTPQNDGLTWTVALAKRF